MLFWCGSVVGWCQLKLSVAQVNVKLLSAIIGVPTVRSCAPMFIVSKPDAGTYCVPVVGVNVFSASKMSIISSHNSFTLVS